MEVKQKKHETPKKQVAEEPCSDSASDQSTPENGAEIIGQAEEAISDIYEKTAQAVSETYEKARNYSNGNPGKTMFIALGVGMGLGFLLGTSSRRSRNTGRFARPVVNALSNIALEFLR